MSITSPALNARPGQRHDAQGIAANIIFTAKAPMDNSYTPPERNGAMAVKRSFSSASARSSLAEYDHVSRVESTVTLDTSATLPQSSAGVPNPALSDRTMPNRLSERSPSPHARAAAAGAMAEALAAGRSPRTGLIRRLSRGAQSASNRLRRRTSTQQSLRMRDQSAGPVLERRRSDSNAGSEYQDISDLELDSLIDDVPEHPILALNELNNALGISLGRSSNISTSIDGSDPSATSPFIISGTPVVKVTRKKRKALKLWLDLESARVCWHSSNVNKSFFIDDVTESLPGDQSQHLRSDIPLTVSEEQLLWTINYGLMDRSKGRPQKSMHLIMPDETSKKFWMEAIDTVIRQRSAIMHALSPFNERSEKSMAMFWRDHVSVKAEKGEKLFVVEDAKSFCNKLQINCGEQRIIGHFAAADTDQTGFLDFPQYRNFVNSFKHRKDIQRLYRNIMLGTDLEMNLVDFLNFLQDDQAIDVEKDMAHWEIVFEKYAKASQKNAAWSEGDLQPLVKTMSPQGFQNFLVSSYNDPLATPRGPVTLDRPLNEYFISSSHNTYLLGRQVAGVSSVRGYINALSKGCRCIEIDCWDGDHGRPVVTHGRTITSKILFEDCVSVIAKYAFVASPYPLIVSLEVHCSPVQQSAMVDCMVKYWHEIMVTETLEPDAGVLPSPEELKGKILVKVKAPEETERAQLLSEISNGRSRARSLGSSFARSPSVEKHIYTVSPFLASPLATSPSDTGPLSASTPHGSTTSGPTLSPSSSPDDSSDEVAASADKMRKRPAKTSKIIPKLGHLGIYTQGIKYIDWAHPSAQTYNHVFSFSENTFEKHCTKYADSKAMLEKHNVRFLMREYPGARRLDSSNFNPLASWRRGVQMAALNWQTYDVHQQVNIAMFAAGSDKTGYVLKPEQLRHAKHLPIADVVNGDPERKEKKAKKLVRFSVEVISAQHLPRGNRHPTGDPPMNPYVEFEMFSAEDKARGIASGEGGTDLSARDGMSGIGSPLRKRTKVVEGNGFDPVFNEQLNMTVQTKLPGLIFVRFTVWKSLDPKKQTSELLASYTVKLSSLQQGYRHLPLFNAAGDKFKEAKLFVKIKKVAPVPLQQDDNAYGIMESPVSPRPELGRADRSWPRRIFSRNPSERRRAEADLPHARLSRTLSVDRHATPSALYTC
nr:1-phosphatidylinositol 4,5-bisphosphate phosphodiesterase 1 [Quercus suber]